MPTCTFPVNNDMVSLCLAGGPGGDWLWYIRHKYPPVNNVMVSLFLAGGSGGDSTVQQA